MGAAEDNEHGEDDRREGEAQDQIETSEGIKEADPATEGEDAYPMEEDPQGLSLEQDH